jgi:general secretion pathway protein M
MMKALQYLKKLNKRERYAIYAGLCLVGLFVISQFIITPIIEKKKRMQNSVNAKLAMLGEMQQFQTEYLSLKDNAKVARARFAKREKGFTLFSFLDQLAGEAGIKDRISYMKPSKTAQKNSEYKISRVEMKLEAITLEQLVSYLYGVETSQNMVDIRKLSITKKDKKQGLISVVMQVETLEI